MEEWGKEIFGIEDFETLVEFCYSNDRTQQHYGVLGLGKLLADDWIQPIQAIIDADMVPRLVRFIQNDNEPLLQLQAIQALKHITYGNTQQNRSIIDNNGIPILVRLLKSRNEDIMKHTIATLGNIAADAVQFRDIILKWGGLEPLLQIVNTTNNRQLFQDGVWAISCLSRGRPLPELVMIESALPTLCMIIKKEENVEVLANAAWALSCITRLNTKAEEVIELGAIPFLIKHLDSTYPLELCNPCVRILGSMLAGTEEQVNTVLQTLDCLTKLFQLLSHEDYKFRRHVCWSISNMTAGSENIIETIISNPQYIETLINIATTDVVEVQREAVWALSNATMNANKRQIDELIKLNVLDCLILLLDGDDSLIIQIVIAGLTNFLDKDAQFYEQGQKEGVKFVDILEAKRVMEKIKKHRDHPDVDVRVAVSKIIEKISNVKSSI